MEAGCSNELVDSAAAVRLVARCRAGDRQALAAFQQQYGEMIYHGVPYGRGRSLDPGDRGDFYVYVFDGGRLFRALRTYRGDASMRTYLRRHVLPDLLRMWDRQRATMRVPCVSLDDMDPPAAPGPPEAPALTLTELVAPLSSTFRRCLQVLCAEDWEATAADVADLAVRSGQTPAAVQAQLAAAQARLRAISMADTALDDALTAVFVRLLRADHEARYLADALARDPGNPRGAEWRGALAVWTQRMAKRQRQRAKLLAASRRRGRTARLVEVAALTGLSIGTVGSYVARARRRLRGARSVEA